MTFFFGPFFVYLLTCFIEIQIAHDANLGRTVVYHEPGKISLESILSINSTSMFPATPPMMERMSLVGEDDKNKIIFQARGLLSFQCMYKIYDNQMNIIPCYHPVANRLSHASGDERMKIPA